MSPKQMAVSKLKVRPNEQTRGPRKQNTNFWENKIGGSTIVGLGNPVDQER